MDFEKTIKYDICSNQFYMFMRVKIMIINRS